MLTSPRPIDKAYVQRATAMGLQAAETIVFPSMAHAGTKARLVQVKAVSPSYPLRGTLSSSPSPASADEATGTLPQAGEIWAEARLFAELGVQPGARVQLGKSTFTLTRVLTREPDRSNNLFQLAPVVLMPLADLPATGLLSPASRATFNQLFTGDLGAIQRFQQELQGKLKPVERIRTLDEDLASVQQTLQRTGRFLGLAALLSVVLAGAAVALTATSLMRRERPAVAVLKAIGMSRQQILYDQTLTLLATAVLAAVLGIMLGFVLQFALAVCFSRLAQPCVGTSLACTRRAACTRWAAYRLDFAGWVRVASIIAITRYRTNADFPRRVATTATAGMDRRVKHPACFVRFVVATSPRFAAGQYVAAWFGCGHCCLLGARRGGIACGASLGQALA